MFLQNKYSRWYFNIIQHANLRSCNSGYIEGHHIIPKCMGGTNAKTNMVSLTAREHFICHLLLTKSVIDVFKKKMNYAYWRMCNATGKRHYPSSNQYALGKQLFTESQNGHRPYLTSHTEETKLKISRTVTNKLSKMSVEERRNRALNSCCSPKTYTKERSKNISISLKGKPKSEAHKMSMRHTYKFVSPSNEEFIYVGLEIGCEMHGLNYGSVRNNLMNNKPYKGWVITYGK